MWVAGISVAALGACFHNYIRSDCSFNNAERCIESYKVFHQNNIPSLNPKCVAAQTRLVYNEPLINFELFSNFINQQDTITLANEAEQNCKEDTDRCLCFNNSAINNLLDGLAYPNPVLDKKTDLAYQTVAAACPLISTTVAQVIINADLKAVDVVGIVTGKEFVPVGAYGFACESDPATFFLIRENRMLAQAMGSNDNDREFTQGIFRNVALSNIEDCQCLGEQVVELVVRPTTNKKKGDKIQSNNIWFDTSHCESNFRDCLIEEMERPCTECAAGQNEVKPCGLFYDTVCRGPPHTKSEPSDKAEVDQTAGIVMLCLFIGIALLVFMSASVEHEVEKASISKKNPPKSKETKKMLFTGF